MVTNRKNKGGRPPALEPDARTLKTLRGLGKINATHVEAADVLGVSRETLERFLGKEKRRHRPSKPAKATAGFRFAGLKFKAALEDDPERGC